MTTARVWKISPTMLSTWERGAGDWIRTYIGVPTRVDGSGDWELVTHRDPQNEAMAAGSAFDSFVKGRLAGEILGENEDAVRDHLFERAVDSGNRDFGRRIGSYLLDEYIRLGAYAALVEEIRAGNGLFMEERVDGTVDGVPISGRPDLYYYNMHGFPVILDWKVSQLGKDKPTIVPGYVMWRGSATFAPKRNVTGVAGGWRHERAGDPLPDLLPRESDQLTFYAWLCGAAGDTGIIGGIDRLVGKPLRVVSYRGLIGSAWQEALRSRIRAAYTGIRELVDGGVGERLLDAARAGMGDTMFVTLTEERAWWS